MSPAAFNHVRITDKAIVHRHIESTLLQGFPMCRGAGFELLGSAEEEISEIVDKGTNDAFLLSAATMQEFIQKTRECKVSTSKIEIMANQLAMLDAELGKAREQIAEQGEQLDQIKKGKQMLEASFELEVETYEALLQKERSQGQNMAEQIKALESTLELEVETYEALLQKERRQARSIAETLQMLESKHKLEIETYEALLQQERSEALNITEQKHMLESTLEVEVATYEALLQKERDQAQKIIDNVRKQGCLMDVEGGLLSDYAKETLECTQEECCVIVHYEKTLANPVGAIVYTQDECCTRVVTAVAAPNRGITAASLEAVKECARRRGDDRLVLDAVENAVPIWHHLGFASEAVQSDGLMRMSMPLTEASRQQLSKH